MAPASERQRGRRSKPSWPLIRLRAALRWLRQQMEPDVLTSEFLVRTFLFRLVLLVLGLSELDESLKCLALGTCGPAAWGMAQRAVALSQLLPILLNGAGLLWPLLNLHSFEARFKCYQRLATVVSVLSRLVQMLGQQPWIKGSAKQHLLFDAFMPIIHQDEVQELLLHLAFVQLVYSMGLLLPQAARSRQEHLAVITQCEYFVMILLLVLCVHKLYCSLVGPRDKQQALQRMLSQLLGKQAAPSGLLLRSLPAVALARLQEWAGSVMREEQRTAQLKSSFTLKFILIKLMHSVHYFVWFASLLGSDRGEHLAGQGSCIPDSSASAVYRGALQTLYGSQLDVLKAAICAAGALSLCALALLAAHGGELYVRCSGLVNGAGLALCATCRVALILLEPTANGSKVAFHNLLSITFSLSAHEDSYRAFLLQLLGFTALFKGVDALMAHLVAGQQLSLAHLLLGSPQYYVLLLVMALIYPASRVGKWAGADEMPLLKSIVKAAASWGGLRTALSAVGKEAGTSEGKLLRERKSRLRGARSARRPKRVATVVATRLNVLKRAGISVEDGLFRLPPAVQSPSDLSGRISPFEAASQLSGCTDQMRQRRWSCGHQARQVAADGASAGQYGSPSELLGTRHKNALRHSAGNAPHAASRQHLEISASSTNAASTPRRNVRALEASPKGRRLSYGSSANFSTASTATKAHPSEAQALQRDRLLLLLELPLCTFNALQPLRHAAALQPRSWAQLLLAAPALVYWLACVAHMALTFGRPQLALRRRMLLWALRLDLTLPLLQASHTLLGTQSGHLSPLRGLMLLMAKWGLLDLGAPLFLKMLPCKVLSFYLLHCYRYYQLGATVTRSQLLQDGLAFLAWPLLAMLLTRGAMFLGQNMVVAMHSRGILNRAVSDQLSTVGHSVAVLGVMLQFLPFLAELQTQWWRSLVAQLDSLGFELFSSASLSHSAVVVLAILGLFGAVSALQSLACSLSMWVSPEERWYQKNQLRVLGFVEQVSSSSSQTLDGIVQALRDMTLPMFGSDFLVKLAVVEYCPDSNLSLAHLHVVHWGFKHVREGLEVRTMPLTVLPSLEHAIAHREAVITNDYAADTADGLSFEDWELQHQTYGVRCCMAVPLVFAGRDLGALMVMGTRAGGLHEPLQRLVRELGVQVAHALYTHACHQELEAGECLLTDMMPTHVSKSVRVRKVTQERMASQDLLHKLSDELLPHATMPGLLGLLPPLLPPPPVAKGPVCRVSSISELSPVTTATNNIQWQDSSDLSSAHQVLYQQWHPAVSILFADIVGFTNISTQVEPEQVMHMLHDLFCRFDDLCTAHGTYKVETIGDCYLACTGVLVETDTHAEQLVEFGKSLMNAARAVQNPLGGHVQIRVGIHSGRAMSGIVGAVRARYTLFGDTVNTASRMESTGLPMALQISDETYRLLPRGSKTQFALRGSVKVKGKGLMSTYLWDEPGLGPKRTEGHGAVPLMPDEYQDTTDWANDSHLPWA